MRAAEVGLAEIGDRSREPRAAIIACYAAMERELAHVPGAVPQDFDTPTEVLARAVENHALHIDNATELVNLFEEARFSPHVMSEAHRESALRRTAAGSRRIAEPGMKKLVALGVSSYWPQSWLTLLLHDRRFVLWAAGVAALFALVNVRQVLGHGVRNRRPAPAPNALEEIVAQLAIANRDADPPVGIHPNRLGPAPASDAGPTVRNHDRPKPGQRPGSV